MTWFSTPSGDFDSAQSPDGVENQVIERSRNHNFDIALMKKAKLSSIKQALIFSS
jgi:hypothetical protein